MMEWESNLPNIIFHSVDQYIAHQSDAVRSALARVRTAVRTAVPELDEVISYNMPTYMLQGRAVLHFAGWKDHYSIYGATQEVAAAFRDELAPYKIQKGTIRFPVSEPVPVNLIARIARFRAQKRTGQPSA